MIQLDNASQFSRRVALVFSSGYAKRAAKNLLRAGLGRKPYLNTTDVFLQANLLRIFAEQPRVTSPGLTSEGAGSQALMIMNAIAFARRWGFEYVHTPFTHISHADRPMDLYAKAWETHFNFGAGEIAIGNANGDVFNFQKDFGFARIHDLSALEDSLPSEFRRKYYLNKRKRINEVFTIAVHIRRGDVADPKNFMWTGTDTFVRTLAQVTEVLVRYKINYRICVYTQGPFNSSGLPDSAELYVDSDPVWTMQEMIEADLLIMSKSLFSYVAAVISDGIKICEQFGPGSYPVFRDWILRTADGDFSVSALERLLKLPPAS